MKAPVNEDPRFVSAYSVYKGLSKLKSYEDTSNDQSIAKRNKKKAKKRNRNKNGKEEEVKVDPQSAAKEVSKAEARPVQQQKKKEQQGPGKNLGGKQGQSKDMSSNNGEQISNGKSKRKKKKKNKKKANEGAAGLDNGQGALDSTVNLSDDDEEPPAKARKTKNMVPNPLAMVKNIEPVKEGRQSTGLASIAKAGKAVERMAFKKKTPINVQMENVVKTVPKPKLVQEKEKPTPSKPATMNGSSTPKTITKANKKTNQTAVDPKPSSSTNSSPYTVTSKVPPVDIRSVLTSTRIEDSVSHAKGVLEWLLNPVTADEFMKTYWEKKPLLVKRKHDEAWSYYHWILTTQIFDDMLRRNPVKYGVNLDITSYVDGKRETLSETMQGRVRPAVVWDYYNNGCSIRMLNPQTYIQPLWRLNSSLQEFFGSFVGANMYLTPPDSQGFAPHYDDIEAFILQIEGKKRWKLYAARNADEVLPRFSSRNFSEETDNLGKPILDVVLEEGDLLYFPRGVIHQAQTVDGEHSLHITLSCNQLNTYGDLLKHHLNHALDKLMAKDVKFRKGLPTDYLSFMGIAHENTTDSELKKKRTSFSKTVEELVTKIAKEPADFASDAMGKKFIWDSLPPYLSSKERETTVVEDGEFMQNGRVFNRVEFGPETKVKFIRKNCVRLVVEEQLIKLYFSTENPLIYHEESDPQYLELSVELAPALNHLISQYPKYTKIEDLPISSNDIGQKIQVVSDLWERGLLFTKEPLEPCDYDNDEFESGESDADDAGKEADASGNGQDEDDVESINLSDLPEDGEAGDSDEFDDDFYDTSMVMDSDDDGSSDDDEEDGVMIDYGDEEGNSEENESEGSYYEIDEDEEPDLGEEEEGEDDEDDEEVDEVEDIDDDGFDFDELDRMEESEEDSE